MFDLQKRTPRRGGRALGAAAILLLMPASELRSKTREVPPPPAITRIEANFGESWIKPIRNKWLGRPLSQDNLNEILAEAHAAVKKNASQLAGAKLGKSSDLTFGMIQISFEIPQISSLTVTPTRWFSQSTIQRALGIELGAVFDNGKQARLDGGVGRLNANPSIKVSATVRRLGERAIGIDVAAREKVPLHVSASVSDSGNVDSQVLRVGHGLRYDNFLGRGNSFSYQLGMTDQYDVDRSQSHQAGLTLPVYETGGRWAFTAAYSDSSSSVVLNDLKFQGSGYTLSGSWSRPLAAGSPRQEVSVSVNYKYAKNRLNLQGVSVLSTDVAAVTVAPAYSLRAEDPYGITSFSSILTLSPGRMVGRNNDAAYRSVRTPAKSDFAYVTFGLGRSQALPLGAVLEVKNQLQKASVPLLSTEQFRLGGTGSVRGYNENQVLADDGYALNAQLSSPNLSPLLGIPAKASVLKPYAFFDWGQSLQLSPDASERRVHELSSVGVGARYDFIPYLSADVAWAQQTLEKRAGGKGDRVIFQVSLSY